MDSVNPNTSSEIIDQSSDAVTGSIECTLECEYNTRMRNDVAFPPADINGEIEEVHKENVSMAVSAVVNDIQQGAGISTDESPKIESELCVNNALTNQNQDSISENVEAGLAGPFGQSSYFLSGSMQIENESEIFVEATAAASIEPVLKEAQNYPEAVQHRGVPRRLEFEDALHTIIYNQPAQSPPLSGGPKSPLEAPLTPIKGKQADTIQPVYPRNMNTTVKIPKPAGIGLHLNSIVNAVQAGSGTIIHVKSAQRRNISIRGKKPTPITNSHLSDSSKSSSIFTIAEDVSVDADDDSREGHASLADKSVTSLSTNIVKSSNNSIILNPVDDQPTPGNKRMYADIETDDNSEDFKSSPKKKRKKSSDPIDDGDGCKRCNCKKSRCLKLYCDCFAAGMYCAEPCACQGCYNRPEYVETVLETRQQIESRNPLAFAPKIVQHTIKPPASNRGEDGTHTTPSSARHKRGCNCKKSMCLKKYCECYQANVGCSDGCGCEGCKNVYGQKGENGMGKYALSKEGANESTDGSLIEKNSLSGHSAVRHSELRNPHNLTPPTPAVQFSNQRKDEPKAWINSGEHFKFPESRLTSATPGSGRSSETAGEILDLGSCDQELYYGNSETLDEFSTVCHQPQNTGNLAGSKSQWFPGNNLYSSISTLSWHGSPNTPMAQSSVSKPLKAVDLEDELSYTTHDDTPDILKDSPAPGNAVKVSSPNKKRISPPHVPQRQFGSSSLVGLRTGRKFILKAVSSFPPLSPCVDPKSTVGQQTNDPQNHAANN